MFDEVIRRWWIIAARGLVAVAFGIAAFIAPNQTAALLVSLFGIFAMADGIFAMGAGLASNWMSLFLDGVAGGAVGLLTYFYPAAAAYWFVPLVAAWAFVTGALEILGALRLRKEVNGRMARGEWLLAASGLLSLVFGVVLVAGFTPTVATLIFVVGSYALLSGALLLALGFTIRTWTPVVG